MEHFEIACRMLSTGCTAEQLSPIVENMKAEIAALSDRENVFVAFAGPRMSFSARDETVKMLALVEHHARLDTATPVIAMVIAYLRRDPAVLDMVFDHFTPPGAEEIHQKRQRRSVKP